MKKLLAMILILAMMLSVLPMASAAEAGMTRQEAEAAVEELNRKSDFYYELADRYAESDRQYHTEVRWWMAEGAHTDQTLEEEVQALYDAGFRGVELCQLDVGGLDGTQWGLGSDQWNHDFHLVVNKALDLGMTVGITSGTNWNTTNVPGLDPDSQAAMQCVIDSTENIAAGQSRTGALPLPGSIRSKANFIGAYAYPAPKTPIRSDSRYLQNTEMPSNPTTYTIETDFILEQESTGFCFSATATNNFIMWQINNGDAQAGKILCRPHVHKNGSWIATADYDITAILGETTETLPGKLMHMKIEVTDGKTIRTYFNHSETAAFTYTVPDAWGTCYLNKLGFRQDLDNASNTEELGRYDNIVVRDADGNVLYENHFDDPENPGFDGPSVKVVDGMLRVGVDQVKLANALEAGAYIDLTDKVVLDADNRTGTLDWTAPEDQNYMIFYLWSQGTAQRSNPAAQPSYCVNYFDRRGFEAWTESFSKTVLSDPELNEKILKGDVQVFMDSLEFNWGSGFTFWSENFAKEFEARKGYDIRPYVILAKGLSHGPTTFGTNADFVRGTYELTDPVLGQKIRNDLHDVQTELYMENLLEPMEQWLNQYNIALRAQISYGRTPEISEPTMAVDFSEAENLNQRNQVDIYRLWTGGAKLENKILSSETGAVFGMEYAYDHQRHLQEAYSLYAAGFSRINWHVWTSSWSPVSVGQSWPGFLSLSICNVLGQREPGYQEYYELNQHLGRVQQLLREGKARTDIGMPYLKYNQEIPFSVSPASDDMYMQRHDSMLFPSTELQEHGYTYDYFSHAFLDDEDVYYNAETGTLEQAGYRALVLWQCWLALDGAQSILKLAKQGLPVVIVDGAAAMSPYDEDEAAFAAVMAELKALPNVKTAASAGDVLESLQTLGVEPYAGFESQQLLTQVRETEDGNRYLYVYNYCNGTLHDGDDPDHGAYAKTEVAMDGTFVPYQIDAWSGKVTQLADYRWENGKTVFQVALDYGDVALYAFEKAQAAPLHIVDVQRAGTEAAAAVRKIEAEDCQLIHAVREDYPRVYTDGSASGGKGVDFIAAQGDGLNLGVLDNPVNQITMSYCTGETGTLGLYADGVWVADVPFTSNGAWSGKYQTVTFNIRPALKAGAELALKRKSNSGLNIDYISLAMNEAVETAGAYVSDTGMKLRATESGVYDVTFSDGKQRQLQVSVPEAYPITGWNVKVEAWTEGQEIFREDTQFGVANREHTFATVKTETEVQLDHMTTWDDIPQVGKNVSGRGYYDATFQWDGAADGAYLDFGAILNSMKVYINGVQTSDVNMNRPVLDISDYLVKGENTIRLVYSSTLTNEMLELGRIRAGYTLNNWGGYYIHYRSYGPSQAVIVPYMDVAAEPAVGEVALTLTGPGETYAQGETVCYTLSGSNMVRLASMIVELELDEAYLTEPTAEALAGWGILAQGWQNGVLRVVLYHLDGVDGDGDLVKVSAKTNGTPGQLTVAVKKAVLSAYDGDGETFVTANLDDTRVTTTIYVNIYDVNRDGVVDLLDITRAQRFYGTNDAICDVNGDGEVNIADLILILNHCDE